MRTLIIGIDPGIGGAVAIIDTETGEVALLDAPVAVVKNGRRNKTTFLPSQMVAMLQPFASRAVAVMEAVHSMPGQGVSSSFSFGHGYGLWEGVLAALGIPYELVPPTRWKKMMMDGMGKEKDASRVRAMQLFPHAAGRLGLVKHHGRADALLLAEYRRRFEATDIQRAMV